jgi:hypothetical protein
VPDEHTLQASGVALKDHGFSVEVAGNLDAARRAVLTRPLAFAIAIGSPPG